MLARPARGAHIEVDPARPEIAPLHGVTKIRVRVEPRAQAAAIREIRMRGDDEAIRPCFQLRHIVERPRRLDRGGRKVQQEDVASLDGALGAGDERDAALARVVGDAGVGELAVVERNRERVEAQPGRAVHQVDGGVGNPVDRVFAGVEMKVYFQHVR